MQLHYSPVLPWGKLWNRLWCVTLSWNPEQGSGFSEGTKHRGNCTMHNDIQRAPLPAGGKPAPETSTAHPGQCQRWHLLQQLEVESSRTLCFASTLLSTTRSGPAAFQKPQAFLLSLPCTPFIHPPTLL